MSGDQQDKPHEASQNRLDELRRKGEIPIGRDLLAASALIALTLVLQASSSGVMRLGEQGMLLLGPLIGDGLHDPSRSAPILRGMLLTALTILWPLLALPALTVLAMLLAQRAIVFSGSRIMPRFDRIDPVKGFGRKFSLSALVEFARNLVKITMLGLLSWWFMDTHLPVLVDLSHHAPITAVMMLASCMIRYLGWICLLFLCVGLADLIWQRIDHRRRNRMSHQDIQDEHRQSEGDPHMKALRRRKAEAIAHSRMIAKVPLSDVIIVNPTHYAVALQWNRSRRGAPVCIAKGVDGMAAQIRRKASEAGVPIHHDPPTARALHATLDPGQQILPEHYPAVAIAIRFADRLRARHRRSRP